MATDKPQPPTIAIHLDTEGVSELEKSLKSSSTIVLRLDREATREFLREAMESGEVITLADMRGHGKNAPAVRRAIKKQAE